MGLRKRPTMTPCKGCGKKIQWCRKPTEDGQAGAAVPVDTSVPVYKITRSEGGKLAELKSPSDEWGVGHHATCPAADDFSRHGRERRAERLQKAREARCALVRLLGHPNATLASAVHVEPPEGVTPSEFSGSVREQLWWIERRLRSLEVDLG